MKSGARLERGHSSRRGLRKRFENGHLVREQAHGRAEQQVDKPASCTTKETRGRQGKILAEAPHEKLFPKRCPSKVPGQAGNVSLRQAALG